MGRGGWQRASPAGSAGHPEDVLLATGECSEDTVIGAVVGKITELRIGGWTTEWDGVQGSRQQEAGGGPGDKAP